MLPQTGIEMTNPLFAAIEQETDEYRKAHGLPPLKNECWECGASGPGVLLTPNIVGHLECAGCRSSARIEARREAAEDFKIEREEDNA